MRERLFYAAVEHPQPIGRRALQLGHGKQVAGLHDDFERVRQVMREAAHFQREFFRELGS